ncbi:hypothetical protein FB451DRAFT_1176043 [Mycena latifolia]|nr:hypothetical protein FB451DRAFT_1176043 [Mycena latifolia]
MYIAAGDNGLVLRKIWVILCLHLALTTSLSSVHFMGRSSLLHPHVDWDAATSQFSAILRSGPVSRLPIERFQLEQYATSPKVYGLEVAHGYLKLIVSATAAEMVSETYYFRLSQKRESEHEKSPAIKNGKFRGLPHQISRDISQINVSIKKATQEPESGGIKISHMRSHQEARNGIRKAVQRSQNHDWQKKHESRRPN